MNRLCLVALIGLPAVGKSTFCHYLMQLESVPFNILHICYDNLINFNCENPTQYKEQRENLLKFLSGIIPKLKNYNNFPTELQTMKIQYKSNQHKDIIMLCDDNHYYRSMRYKLFQLAREHSMGYCQIYFKCDLNLALERNTLRSGSSKVPNDIIVQMCNRLEFPNIFDNKWEKNTLVLENLNFYKTNCNEIISYIIQFLDKPQHSLEMSVSKLTPPHSEVHELDLLMRKRIQILMNSTKEQNKKILAKRLNDKRKETLKHFQMDKANQSHDGLDLNKYVEMLNNV